MAKNSEPLTQTSVRLYQSDAAIVKRIANEQCIDQAHLIRRIIRDYVKTQGEA